MIVLYTNDTKIEVASDNPVYDSLIPLDGKFVGVTFVEEEVVEEPKEETEVVNVDGTAYFQELEEVFPNKSAAYLVLLSNAQRFLSGQTKRVKVLKEVVNPDFRVSRDDSGYLIAIPNRLVSQ